MGKREKNLKAAKYHHEEEEEEQGEDEELQLKSTKSRIVMSSSSDDEEANEDLSLKIVQKAMLRTCTAGQRSDSVSDELRSGGGAVSIGVIDLSSSPSQEDVAAATDVKIKNKSRKEKKKNKKVAVPKDEEDVEIIKAIEIDEFEETNPVEISDNIVLRKLLRGPRYFDPPDSGWGTCYNCGEEGHKTVNCTSAKRRKPCFVCGSLEHNAKQCTKGKDCFICKKGGHRAKDCLEKYKRGSQYSKICLKCGDSGHDMFSCKQDYSPDDLKEMQCYICKSFGHLCCVDFTDTGLRELSCYRCGQLGHSGLECTRSRGETPSVESLGSCFRCGEGGHFAHECSSSTKVRKRNFELSTPTQKFSKGNKDCVRVRSVPSDLSKVRKRRKSQYDGEFTTPSNSKRRGGWITEDPGDLPRGKAKVHGWGSPVTPTNKRNKSYTSVADGHASSSHSSRMTQKLHFGASASNGSSKFYQHRYSASRFGNSSSDGMRRNYDW